MDIFRKRIPPASGYLPYADTFRDQFSQTPTDREDAEESSQCKGYSVMAENTGNNTTIPQCPASPFTAHSYFPNYATKASSIATAALNGVSMPFTILLNAFMMIIIVKNPSLRQKERVMAVLYLSVTDLFTGLISQPLFIAKEISHLNNTERDCAVEEAFYFILPIFGSASLFHLVVVAYDRHVAINQPYQYFTRITVRRLTYTSIVMWTLAIVFNTSFFLLFYFLEYQSLLMQVVGFVGMTLPLVLIIFLIYCNGRVFFTLRKTKLNIQQEQAHLSHLQIAAQNNQ
ncbi:hypothetical protein QZH41_006592, partial [Actinostola sp. cb2023]